MGCILSVHSHLSQTTFWLVFSCLWCPKWHTVLMLSTGPVMISVWRTFRLVPNLPSHLPPCLVPLTPDFLLRAPCVERTPEFLSRGWVSWKVVRDGGVWRAGAGFLKVQELNFGLGKLEICAPFLKGTDMIHQVILQRQGPERERTRWSEDKETKS